MTNPQKDKGAQFEREVASLLHQQLGYPAKRALGAGRKLDTGDIYGIPRTVIQCANWANVLQAIRHKPLAADEQRFNADADFALTVVKLRGNVVRWILTTEQACTLLREALA